MMVKNAVLIRLQWEIQSRVLINEPMQNHTSWRIGGPAEYFIEPHNPQQLVKCIKLAAELNLPLTIIGKGTNLLVKDSGIPGMVVKIGKGFDTIHIDGSALIAGAGAMLPRVAREAMERGLEGFAWSAGIPGTVGGAVIMNAGAHGSCIADVLQQATIIDEAGVLLKLAKDQMGFNYRTSALQGRNAIVVEVEFILRDGNRETIKNQMQGFINKRKQVQPQGYPNAGSVFKNPPGDSAGRLIEMAGCKGLTQGNAQISQIHANWIVNLGGASAQDVLNLIEIAKERVKQKFNVDLQLEVRVLG